MKSLIAVLLCCAACVPPSAEDPGDDTYGCRDACAKLSECRDSRGNSRQICLDSCVGTVEAGLGSEEQVNCIVDSACGTECNCGFPGVACIPPAN